MSKIHVYFMPGMAASSSIFERIALDGNIFETHLLEWSLPHKNETLKGYAKRKASEVTHDNAVLIGVSFGGLLVQEMKAFLHPAKVIIISSIKSNTELPGRMKMARATGAYKLLPTTLVNYIDRLAQFAFGDGLKRRLSLYEKFLSVRDKSYLDWSIAQIINWDRVAIDPTITHIHGDADEVFPIKNISKCTVVKGGTHIMILTKYKWLNENLPKIILAETNHLA